MKRFEYGWQTCLQEDGGDQVELTSGFVNDNDQQVDESISKNVAHADSFESAERAKWDRYYATIPLVEEDSTIHEFGQEFARRVSEFLPLGSRVLEAGCGAGWQSLALARTGRFTNSLLDFSPEALRHAHHVFQQAGVTAEFIEGSVFTPGRAEYDLVFNAGVLEHYTFDQQVDFLRGMASRTRNYVLVLVPNKLCYWYWLWRMQKVGAGEWPYGKEVPLIDLSQAFEAAGLHFVGRAFMGASWSESFISDLSGITEERRHEILEVHRSRVDIPDAQKSYLVAFLGSVRPLIGGIPKVWTDTYARESMRDAEVNATLADAISLRIGAEGSIIRLKNEQAEIEQQLLAVKAEREQLKARTQELTQKVDDLGRLAQESERLHGQNDYLRADIETITAERDQAQALLAIFYDTKAWRWTSAYWRMRSDGIKGVIRLFTKMLLFIPTIPFRLAYMIIYLFYHLLVPRPLRIALWEWRWRVTHKQAAGGRKGKQVALSRAPILGAAKHDGRTPKATKHVFIFGMVPYYDIGGGQRSAQLAKTFNRIGCSVHYVYAYEATDNGRRDTYVPAVKHVHIDDFTPRDLIHDLQGEPLFVFEAPYAKFLPFLDLARRIRAQVVYEHIDNWDTSLGSFFFNEDVFHSFLSRADLIVATAEPLREKVVEFMSRGAELLDHLPRVHYVPNAVDTDLFEPLYHHQKPVDLVQGKPTLLYYGSLWGEWFDWDLVRQVAEQCPEAAINLIGDFKPVEDKVKALPSNVHVLGPKLQAELPAYLHCTDFAILPFKNDEIGRYVSPLKVFEYIAMDVAVLATPLPDIIDYPGMYVSEEASDWIRAVRGEVKVATGSGPGFATENNWYARCNFILDQLDQGQLKHKLPDISVIVLNYNNQSVIGRCVDSLLRFRGRYEYEVIVVDNQSTDGSYEFLEEHFGDKITLLRNAKNGCSSGRNLGIQHASGSHILFLDSDQWVVSSRWLDPALDVLEKHRSVGAVGWVGGWLYREEMGGPITADLPHGGVTPDTLFRTDIGYLGTGGMLIRREALDGVDWFDEFYDPTCYEDTDLSFQIRDAGFELAYCPYTSINHLPHQSTQSGSDGHRKLMVRNGKYFLDKWRARNPSLLTNYYVR